MTTLENRPNTALLVIDMQNNAVERAHNRDAVVANVADLVERARREGVPVVWVQHSDVQLARGSDGWQIISELTPGDAEPLAEKNYGDSFEDTTLETALSGLGVGRVVVVGAQTDWCVRSTLHGALARGYDAILVSDAHTTEDQTAWGRRRRTGSSRTRTCTGHTRPLQGEPPGPPTLRPSTSAGRPSGSRA
jgi:nicotinamidase-related amidase